MRWCLTRLNVPLIVLPITLPFVICSRTSIQVRLLRNDLDIAIKFTDPGRHATFYPEISK